VNSLKNRCREWWREAVLGALLLATLFVWFALWQRRPGPLKVFFLDVGQGDAIFIETPTHKRFLLDGGPNGRVLAELGQVLPFGAQTIDAVIESHPDSDHITGLVPVLEKYRVGLFLEPGVESANTVDDTLKAEAKARGVPDLWVRRGMVLDFGDGVKLEILFPNQDVSHWETNDASIVAKLVYGKTSFLLTGDSPIKTENILLKLDPTALDSDVLKAGHHGSKTSTSLLYAEAVSPAYAIISAGTGNKYGHPSPETLETLQKVGAEVLATEDVANLKGRGTIEFDSDGAAITLK
jgi:competence protein ComEC